MIPSINVQADRMADAVREGYLEATDLADFLVERGVPFREAHGIIGKMVRYCVQQKRRLPELSVEELARFSDHFDASALRAIEPEAMLRRRNQLGATAPDRVKAALKAARKRL
jgi:argininosuccinate lyase